MANISLTTPDSLFPSFEEHNFNGGLTQFRAHLRRYGAEEVLDNPMPTDKDANGNPIPMNARDRADFDRRVKEYKEKDNSAYPELIKACYKIQKLKVFAKLLA
jgi:hypothetical protein